MDAHARDRIVAQAMQQAVPHIRRRAELVVRTRAALAATRRMLAVTAAALAVSIAALIAFVATDYILASVGLATALIGMTAASAVLKRRTRELQSARSELNGDLPQARLLP